jgi:selenocysteine lyase/cysteine desulfurase
MSPEPGCVIHAQIPEKDSDTGHLVELVAPLGWTPYRPLNDPAASPHIISLRHPTATIQDVQAALAHEHNIITSSRGNGIRVSLHAYNHQDDVHALAHALASIEPSRYAS